MCKTPIRLYDLAIFVVLPGVGGYWFFSRVILGRLKSWACASKVMAIGYVAMKG